MNFKPDISEEELQALLGQRNDGASSGVGDSGNARGGNGSGSESGKLSADGGGKDGRSRVGSKAGRSSKVRGSSKSSNSADVSGSSKSSNSTDFSGSSQSSGSLTASAHSNVSDGLSGHAEGSALPWRAGEDARVPLHAADRLDGELLQALKEVVKTLTVRVASLEGEVGRLRAELAASRGELASAEPRIVVEGVTLPSLAAEREASAAAETQPPLGRRGDAAALMSRSPAHAGTDAAEARSAELGGAAWPAIPGQAGSPSDAAAAADANDARLMTRAARHRKPKKKGFFARLFE